MNIFNIYTLPTFIWKLTTTIIISIHLFVFNKFSDSFMHLYNNTTFLYVFFCLLVVSKNDDNTTKARRMNFLLLLSCYLHFILFDIIFCSCTLTLTKALRQKYNKIRKCSNVRQERASSQVNTDIMSLCSPITLMKKEIQVPGIWFNKQK